MRETSAGRGSRRYSPLRLLPIAVLAAGLVAFFAFDLDDYVRFETLRQHRETIVQWVAANWLLAAALYILGYAVMAACSIPGAALASIVGGFLFGTAAATACVVVGATAGATVLFLAARTAFADILRARAGSGLEKMERGFRENALSYLLFLRLVPIFPFVLVNLVPAFLGVSLRVFVIGTFIGIIPGAIVYTSVGVGVGALLEAGRAPDLHIILQPRVLLPMLALAALAMIPVLYKTLRKTKN